MQADAPSRGHDLKLAKGSLITPKKVDAPSRGHDLKHLFGIKAALRRRGCPLAGA